nr:hypothetical protein [Tanacetum cinerariifolium]
MMSFLPSVVSSRYPTTNNQLRTSSNPLQQATINNGRVTIQPIQGRHNFVLAGSSRPFTSGQGGAEGKQRVITCYNCKGEGYGESGGIGGWCSSGVHVVHEIRESGLWWLAVKGLR